MIKTGRDPFARHDIRKYSVPTNDGCDECGQNHRGRLWQYYVDPDHWKMASDIKGRFCGIDCLNSYHG